MHAVLEGELGESEMVEGREAQNVRNHALIHYLATLANSNSTKDTFDFDFVESLLKNGADINSTDKTGQTVFHEVARSWNLDVATFLIKNGINSTIHIQKSPAWFKTLIIQLKTLFASSNKAAGSLFC